MRAPKRVAGNETQAIAPPQKKIRLIEVNIFLFVMDGTGVVESLYEESYS